MPKTGRKYDPESCEGVVRIVEKTGRSIAGVVRDLGIHPATLEDWVKQGRVERDDNGELCVDERARLAELERENAELWMAGDALEQSVVVWVEEAT